MTASAHTAGKSWLRIAQEANSPITFTQMVRADQKDSKRFIPGG